VIEKSHPLCKPGHEQWHFLHSSFVEGEMRLVPGRQRILAVSKPPKAQEMVFQSFKQGWLIRYMSIFTFASV